MPQFPLPVQGSSQGGSQGTQIPGVSQSAAAPKQTCWQFELLPHASWQQVVSQLPSWLHAVLQHCPVHGPIQFPKHAGGSPTHCALQELVQLLLQSEPASANAPSGDPEIDAAHPTIIDQHTRFPREQTGSFRHLHRHHDGSGLPLRDRDGQTARIRAGSVLRPAYQTYRMIRAVHNLDRRLSLLAGITAANIDQTRVKGNPFTAEMG
jgi:hypothetical protein